MSVEEVEAELLQAVPRPGMGKVLGVLLLMTAGLSVLFVVGWRPRERERAALVAHAEKQASVAPAVTVARAKRAGMLEDLELPASVRPLQDTAVYARATGYMKKWNVDIGATVEAGQVLAELETPERDQELKQAGDQVEQAKAHLATTEAQLTLAEATVTRYRTLRTSGGVSVQDLAEREAQLNTARSSVAEQKANVSAAEANVRRLTELLAFNRVVAPFAGTVTFRNAEVGALVNAVGGQPLFRIVQTDPVRVQVYAPQSSAVTIKVGQDGWIEVPEEPDRRFPAKVARTARALDAATRTLLVELEAPNHDHALLPGMYVRAHLQITRTRRPLMVPASAVITGSTGTRVCTVVDGKIRYRAVELDVDRGTEIGIRGGLEDLAMVVLSPSDELTEGRAVEIVAPRK